MADMGKTIKEELSKAVKEVADKTKMSTSDAAKVKSGLETVLEKSPEFINATNSEPAYQSRVGVGGAVGIIGALGILLPIVAGWFGYDIAPGRVVEIGSAILALWGPGYALYGRFYRGLRPLFGGGS